MYVRENVTGDIERVIIAVEGFLVQVESIAQGARIDGLVEEAEALVEAASRLPEFIAAIHAWTVLADEAERDWRAFLEAHPELN